jgi:hypothetical protein
LPGPGPTIAIGPVSLLNSSEPAGRVMTDRLAKAALSKVMVAPPSRTSARLTAWRRLSLPRPAPPNRGRRPVQRRCPPRIPTGPFGSDVSRR